MDLTNFLLVKQWKKVNGASTNPYSYPIFSPPSFSLMISIASTASAITFARMCRSISDIRFASLYSNWNLCQTFWHFLSPHLCKLNMTKQNLFSSGITSSAYIALENFLLYLLPTQAQQSRCYPNTCPEIQIIYTLPNFSWKVSLRHRLSSWFIHTSIPFRPSVFFQSWQTQLHSISSYSKWFCTDGTPEFNWTMPVFLWVSTMPSFFHCIYKLCNFI